MQNSTKFVLAITTSLITGAILGGLTGKFFPLQKEAPTKNPIEESKTGSSNSAGTSFVTTVTTEGIGEILLQVNLPESARYKEGAPIIVNVPTFYTPEISGFHPLDGITDAGGISLSLMYPGRSDGNGNSSDGTDDFGGSDSIKALRDTILFAMGEKNNSEGLSLKELSAIEPLYSNVGIYAFSHPGIAATAVLGSYPEELKNVAFYVGRENPTIDLLSTLELGHWNVEGKTKVADPNPLYNYPEDYSSTKISIDYSSVNYDQSGGAPYFDTNNNDKLDTDEFSLGIQVPTMFGKRFYSRNLLHALEDNGALTASDWPSDLATPADADTIWPDRETLPYYSKISSTLHVMLVFAAKSHVQVSEDQPSVHQTYDGFSGEDIWIRLNPDSKYVDEFSEADSKKYVEHDANSEPSDWADVSKDWAYGSGAYSAVVPLAAVFEMADRSYKDNWNADLSSIIK